MNESVGGHGWIDGCMDAHCVLNLNTTDFISINFEHYDYAFRYIKTSSSKLIPFPMTDDFVDLVQFRSSR